MNRKTNSLMIIYINSLFIFRRDLRLHDNTGLNEALRISKQVLPCFIFDPRQIHPHAYQNNPAQQFMLQSLNDLEQQLLHVGSKLQIYNDLPEQVIKRLVYQHKIEAVFINRDYTPFSRQRDNDLFDVCQKSGICLHILPDALLIEPEQALKNDKTCYKVFTAFYNHVRRFPVALPQKLVNNHFFQPESERTTNDIDLSSSGRNIYCGGRQQALYILDNILKQADYLHTRDFPALNTTSKLSAHLKYGTCSVRDVYLAISEKLDSDHPLLRQLYWRDFFTHIAYHFPHVFDRSFLEKYANLQWDNNLEYFQAWICGKTGFPIVDAGMRELNSTGFMHNRLRMIVASFLTKDLHVNWRWGERYFAQRLIDYDPSVNNGNWQWAASTGCDAQPYFRIFNPWLQQQKFDADCQYIYRWIPELKMFSPKAIHHWYNHHQHCHYPAPMIDHHNESQKTKVWFKESIKI